MSYVILRVNELVSKQTERRQNLSLFCVSSIRGDPTSDTAQSYYLIFRLSIMSTTIFFLGVSLTHYNMVANLSQLSHPEVLIEGLRNLENQETTVAVLPFFHIYAMNCIMTFGLRLGGKLVTVPRFEPEMYISCLVNYKVSSMHTNTESQITFTRTVLPQKKCNFFF